MFIEEIAKINMIPRLKSKIKLLRPNGRIIQINNDKAKAKIGENRYKKILT